MADACEQRGWRVDRRGACDAVIINSCAVTAEAVRQSLQSLRRARQRYPAAQLVLTGCAAKLIHEQAQKIENVSLVCGNAGKSDLVARLARLFTEREAEANVFALSGELPIAALRAGSGRRRQRAEIKIQDGCNSFCRYCIIPYLRGRARSLPAAKIMDECRALAAAGFREVVLTGIHIGAYGTDLDKSLNLAGLLRKLLDEVPGLRFRLGSLQPHELSAPLLEMICDPAVAICEHLHLSLQSGSNRVLAAMGRPYRRREIIKLLGRIRQSQLPVAVGTDLIVGFPAEKLSAFEETLALVKDFPFAYLHVFPYSPRQLTVSASWPDRISVAEKKQRVAVLTALGEEQRRHFAVANLGLALEVLIEKRYAKDPSRKTFFGHSRNYLPVVVEGLSDKDVIGKVCTVVANGIDGRNLLARAQD